MKFTVANRITGGFTLITLLLLFLSASAISSFNQIQSATNRVSQMAVPTLDISGQLKGNIIAVGSRALLAYFESDPNALSRLSSQYDIENEEYQQLTKQLAQVTLKDPKLKAALMKIEGEHRDVRLAIEQLFVSRSKSIAQQQQVEQNTEKVLGLIDDTIDAILRLWDIDNAEQRIETALAQGDRIESTLISLIDTTLNYQSVIESVQAKAAEAEIEFVIGTARSEIDYLKRALERANLTAEAEEISSYFNEAAATLVAGGALVNAKHQQITALEQADSSLQNARTAIDSTSKVVDNLLNLAKQTTNEAQTSVEDSIDSGSQKTYVAVTISIVIAIIIAKFTVSSIVKPLERVNNLFRIVASGDMTQKLDESGRDEFTQLSKNCNQLIDTLRQLIGGIASRSTQLSSAAEETSAVTAQSNVAIEEQRNQVEQAATATTQMSATSQSVLASANDALGEIKQADAEATRVIKLATHNKATIESLANEVESAAEVINQLEQNSTSIGGILDVIRGIAEQTNLLALNAAIEAARAGEQGRGFAVVADEVRMLASRTQESTEEIQQMIESLQLGAQQAVTVMETGKTKATTCVEQTENAARAMENITHAVHQAFDRSSQIATAAEEQNVVAQEISHNLESIVSMTEQATAGSQQTAKSSSEVAQLAEELQQSIQEFKV